MNAHLRVIIPAYNSAQWLKKTLDSVERQTYRNFSVCVIDDASTQKEQRDVIEKHCHRLGWKAIYREKNQGALANIILGIQSLSPDDDDVILLLDGDDWLYNKHVFQKIIQEYRQGSVLMTFGQFITYPRWQTGLCRPLTKEILEKKNFREVPFVFSHLRTFKYKIWKLIDDKDFRDEHGNYFKAAWDLAIMYPLLEMTGGESCKFIDEFLYVYNMDNPLNDSVAHKELQTNLANYIRSKPAYKQVFNLKCPEQESNLFHKWRNQWITIYRKFITPKTYKLAARKIWKKWSSKCCQPFGS